jgi:hypothetical protein
MNNYLQVELGGKRRGLKFNLGTYFIVKDFASQKSKFALNKQHTDFAIVVYAAFDDVVRWVMDVPNTSDAEAISSMFVNITKIPDAASPEGGDDTQQTARTLRPAKNRARGTKANA